MGSSGDVRYNIKVCGSLALTHGNPCAGQAGVCRYRTAAAGSDGGAFMTAPAGKWVPPFSSGGGTHSLAFV